ncbi:hypothetical protein SDC9_156101 [bioreactor metagenome]|uniref:Uncharacterized protein n=1 Tax=bioreactor metagenome TaxID=1076179 RepID=A0A645F5B9_9ZZZZ
MAVQLHQQIKHIFGGRLALNEVLLLQLLGVYLADGNGKRRFFVQHVIPDRRNAHIARQVRDHDALGVVPHHFALAQHPADDRPRVLRCLKVFFCRANAAVCVFDLHIVPRVDIDLFHFGVVKVSGQKRVPGHFVHQPGQHGLPLHTRHGNVALFQKMRKITFDQVKVLLFQHCGVVFADVRLRPLKDFVEFFFHEGLVPFQ